MRSATSCRQTNLNILEQRLQGRSLHRHYDCHIQRAGTTWAFLSVCRSRTHLTGYRTCVNRNLGINRARARRAIDLTKRLETFQYD